MLGLDWAEIAVIGVVALIAIGPKDLPVAIKAVTEMLKKARRMASEFQGHVDEMVRDANLNEVRDGFKDIRNLDIRGRILNAVDADGSLQRTVKDVSSPYVPSIAPVPAPTDAMAAFDVPAYEPHVITGAPSGAGEAVAVLERPVAPAMIPPGVAAPPLAPAMIPPADAARPLPA